MSEHHIDYKSAPFMQFAREGNFSDAHASLEQLSIDAPLSPRSLATWKAHLFHMEGKVDTAVGVLAPFIQADDISGRMLRHHRAMILLWGGQLDDARADLQALLDDNHPRIAALHVGCRLQLAYILAMSGDPEFETVIAQVPDGRDYFIKDAIRGKDDLTRIYRANSRKKR